MNRRSVNLFVVTLAIAMFASSTQAQHQTDSVTPAQLDSPLSYQIELKQYDFGAAALPTLHSYAAAEYGGMWVLIAGRTNGLHGFENISANNFPSEFQNREVWVIDPVNKQSWSRSLLDVSGGLTTDQVNSLTSANNQFCQQGDRLYMTGGYGVQTEFPDGTEINGTFDELSAIDLPGLVDWVVNGTGTAADNIRQVSDPIFSVTGGAMYEIDGRTHLVFGQDFKGNYNPGKNGTYTKQVRSFDIVDDGSTLSFVNDNMTPQVDAYRRRDLNIFPVLQPDGLGEIEEGLVVLSGVFTESFGAWTVPVEIDANGIPTMADPDAPDTFKQGMNGYHSAKLGLFSEASGEMHEMLFGGISLQYFDSNTNQIETDDFLPFINDITSVVIDSLGNYSQHRLGEFPEINDLDGDRLRFGANAEFFAAAGIEMFDNGVIKLDALSGETALGYIYGGLAANGPHTRGVPDVISSASNMIFEVVLTTIPEPNTSVMFFLAGLILFTSSSRLVRVMGKL
jgi:hypothetical protein